MTDAKQLTQSLGGRWHGRYGTAPCPVCQPERRKSQDALTLADGRTGLLAHCKRGGCAFRDIAAAADITPGSFTAQDPAQLARRIAEEQREAEKRAAQALSLWMEAQPIGGTLAETYLRGRGITCDFPPALRFVPSCWHTSGRRFPAMVAAVEGCERMAVHRTYLRSDGTGKADAEPAKAMLGGTQSGSVRLTEGPGALVVCEGIETGLSLASVILRDPATVWAALSASGLRGLYLPPSPGRLTIAPDGDAPGRAAAHSLAERAHALGWHVTFLTPPDGCDWNDVLTEKAVAA